MPNVLKIESTATSSSPQNKMAEDNVNEEHCSGWLWIKSGRRIRSWKRRFFRLQGPLLSYYKKFPAEEYLPGNNNNNVLNPQANTDNAGAGANNSHNNRLLAVVAAYVPMKGETPPEGVIRVAHVEQSSNSNIAFKAFGISGKVLDVRTDTPKTCKRWVKALTIAASQGRRKEDLSLDSENEDFVSLSNIQINAVGTNESTTNEPSDVSSIVQNYVEKYDWLQLKDSKRDSSYKSKFFVIQGGMIAYHENDLPWTVPSLRGYVVSVQSKKDDKVSLIIELSLLNKNKLEVKAESEAQRDIWYEALRTAARTAKTACLAGHRGDPRSTV